MSKTDRVTATPTRVSNEEGIDLSQLYERLSLTPTDRLRKNFRMAVTVEELRKAGQKHRDRNRRRETA